MHPEGDDVNALAAELRDAAGLLIRRIRSESGTALTWSQSVLLSGLARRGEMTASELAAENGLRPQTVWASLDMLERRGLVSRTRGQVDRRHVLLALTEEGTRELGLDRATRERWLAGALIAQFSPDELDLLRRAVPLLIALAHAPTGDTSSGAQDAV